MFSFGVYRSFFPRRKIILTKIYEATNVYDKYRGKNTSPNNEGGIFSNKEIQSGGEKGTKENGNQENYKIILINMVTINTPTNIKRIQMGSPFQGKKVEELKAKAKKVVKKSSPRLV